MMQKTLQIGQAFVTVNVGLRVLNIKVIAPLNDKKMVIAKLYNEYNAPDEFNIDVLTYDRDDAVEARAALEWGTGDA